MSDMQGIIIPASMDQTCTHCGCVIHRGTKYWCSKDGRRRVHEKKCMLQEWMKKDEPEEDE